MRRWISLVEFGLSVPEVRLDEVEVIDQLAGDWREFPLGKEIGEAAGLPVFENEIDGHLVYELGNPSECYMICSVTVTGWKMLMEARVKPGSEKRGLSSALLQFVVRRHGRVILDRQMSRPMIGMVEKLVAARIVGANIADLATGEMREYNPERDQLLPLYDEPVNERPVADRAQAKNLVWILEGYSVPRAPILAEMVRKGPVLTDVSPNWWRMSEAELRQFANQYVGWATNEMGDPNDLHWTVESLDVDVFMNYANDWEHYYSDECIQDRYDDDFLSGDFHTPIVVSFEPELIIWDGYHRIAVAVHCDNRHINAVVGRP